MAPVIPLYKNENIPKSYNDAFNTGLWYDKFCHVWPSNLSWSLKATDRDNFKINWIKTVTDKKIGQLDLIESHIHRIMDLTHALSGQTAFYKTQYRFVTGLGREHPVENGFAWHHTLGTPYLPGSSVKGMVRSFAKTFGAADTNNTEHEQNIRRIFGFADKQDTGSVGSVVFLDALPVSTIKLELDIMTPHYSDYYQKDNTPPGDWLSPSPIPFLTVAPNEKFMFTLLPRDLQHPQALDDLKLALKWLEDALCWTGAGAKTAVGYGRFMPDDKTAQHWEQQKEMFRQKQQHEQSLQAMSAIRREMEEDGYSQSENLSIFMEGITNKWLDRMEDTATAIADRKEIAKLLANWYQTNHNAQWKKPNKKNKAKINRIKAVLNQ